MSYTTNKLPYIVSTNPTSITLSSAGTTVTIPPAAQNFDVRWLSKPKKGYWYREIM